MKFKKVLAGALAAALAAASLPMILSAEEEEVENSILHWTLTAKSGVPITVVPGVSESEPDEDDGPYVSPYEPHIIKFDLGDIEEEMPSRPTVRYLILYTHNYDNGYTWSNYIDATAGVNEDDNGNYNFICAIPTSILNDENITFEKVVAYLTLGNTVAELEVDLTSDEVQSFTVENNQPVKIVGDNPNAEGSFELRIGYMYLDSWDISELDTLYLPLPPRDNINYAYYLYLYSQENGADLNYSSEATLFTVEEGGITLNLSYIIPDLEFITVKLDKSELPADKYLNRYDVYTYTNISDDNGMYIGHIGKYTHINANESDEITLDEVSVFEEYATAQLVLSYPYGYNSSFTSWRNETISYSFADSLEDGATVQLGTDFTSGYLTGYNYYGEYHPGDSLTLREGNRTDKYGNRNNYVYLYAAIPVTVTFTNIDDPDDVYTIERTVKDLGSSINCEVTLPEGMNGKYDIELYAERTIDLSEVPEEPTTTTTTTTPFVTEPVESDESDDTDESEETVTSTEAAAEPTADIELSDEKTGVKIMADDGVLDENVELKVDIGSTTVAGFDHIYVLDITLVNEEGENVQPDGYVTVTIPVPQYMWGLHSYYIYYQADDGTLVDMRATYADGYVTFTTNHFSTYILSTEQLIEESEETTVATEAAATTTTTTTAASAATTTEAATTTTTVPAATTTTAPAATTAAPVTTSHAASDNGSTTDNDKNVATGAVILIIPAAAAAAGIIISKRRR